MRINCYLEKYENPEGRKNTCHPGARFTKVKSLLSSSLTGAFPIKKSTGKENCDSRAW